MANYNKPWNKGKIMSADTAPTLHPTTKDIAWAAGIFEGEGTCGTHLSQRAKVPGVTASVAQKDDWLCPKLRDLFGGRVRTYKAYCNGPGSEYREYHRWDLSGVRALGFIQTIYLFLSPRRQAQVRACLDAVRVTN